MPGRRPRVGLGTCRALPAGSLSKWLRHFGWGDGADHFRPAGGGPWLCGNGHSAARIAHRGGTSG